MTLNERYNPRMVGGGDLTASRLRALNPRESSTDSYSGFTSLGGYVREGVPPYSSSGESLLTSLRRDGEVKRQLYVDVAFLVDVTGSMQPWVNAVHEKLNEIITAITSKFPAAILRTAFVGYRDITDSQPVIYKDFQDYPQELQEFVRGVVATGGGDQAEDVLTGIETLLQLNWASKIRHVIHIGDAPHHGREFHGPSVGDSYPDGLPGERRPAQELLRIMCEKRIQYTFLKLNETTNEMISAFNTILRTYHKGINETTMRSPTSDFVPAVVASIASSLPPNYSC